MAPNILTSAAVALALTAPRPSVIDDVGEIRKLIPQASAMAREDFEKLARATTVPKASDLKEKSLTLALFALWPKEDKKAKEEFQFLTEVTPKPAELAREIYRAKKIVGDVRFVLGPVTFIHADRITRFRCDVDGDTATGTVWFEVPKLYRGKVNYIARRKDGKWHIVEFRMPTYGIHLVRGAKGIWQEKEPPKTPNLRSP